MKFLLYLVVIAATAWAGWFSHPRVTAWMAERIDARKAEQEKEIAAAVSKAADNGPSNSSPGSKTTTRASDLLANLSGKPADPANPSGAGTPPPTTPNAPPKPTIPVAAAPVDEIDARYPMPTFKTIEQITKDWSAIPFRAFPRKVKTKVPLTFEGAVGKIELPAGSEARAAAMVAGMLIVMREGDDTTRIEVPLANTDLKEKLTDLYERYKNFHRDRVIKQREHARALKARANGASDEQMKLAGPKPEVRAGGVIPIMMESLQSSKLTELKPENVTSWGSLNYEEVDGTVYWTGTVQCTVENALFGPQPTEVMALMKDNKVVKWIYTGSREPVQ